MLSGKNKILSKVSLFVTLTPAEIEELARRTLERRFDAGEVLFHEGDPCHGFFVLGQGRVKIFKTSATGREITLAIESAPSSVAEVPLFDGGPYPATVSALDEVVAYLISKQDFRKVCLNNPQVALKVLAAVGQRLRQLVGIIESVSFGSVRQRLAQALLDHGRQAGTNPFPMTLTHQQLASHLGTVREVVSRNLSRFQADGLIRIHRRQVEIVDTIGLQSEADTEF